MRVLVEIHGDKLGDLAIDVALLRSLEQEYPGLDLEVVITEQFSGLVEDCSFIHWKHLIGSAGHSFLKVAANVLLSTWNLVILAENSKLRMICPFIRSEKVLDEFDRDQNMVDAGVLLHRLSVLRNVIPTWHKDINCTIPLLEGRVEHACRLAAVEPDERILAIAPGSSGREFWVNSSIPEVIKPIADKFDKILVLGRSADARYCIEVANLISARAIAGSVPMPYTCALLSKIDLLIGTDECIAHVSAAFGTKTLLIGGNENNYRCPWQQHMIVGRPSEISSEEISAAIVKVLPDGD